MLRYVVQITEDSKAELGKSKWRYRVIVLPKEKPIWCKL
jgi:hypothetical protein